MFGFSRTKDTGEKDKLDVILARHNANLAAERKAPARTEAPRPVFTKKADFGKRRD
jgi:hypothetical protein